MRHLTALALAAVVFPLSLLSQTVKLRSPWDLHPVTAHDGTYACPTPQPLPKDIVTSDYYSDSKHSVIDPKRYAAYQESQKPVHELTRVVEAAADEFQASGNKGAAFCAFTLLRDNARAGAMTGSMSSNQAWYVQGWTLGAMATAWLKVRTAEPGSMSDRKLVTDWFLQLAHASHDYFAQRNAQGKSDGTNNHLYWAGFDVMAAAIAANDRNLYEWGESTYSEALRRIEPDGTLPLEIGRGQRALHYHLFALQPLIMIAEFGEANGTAMYAAHNYALKRLVDRTVSGLTDNSYFTQKAGAPQDTPEKDGRVKSDDILPLRPYNRRFPSTELTKLLNGVEAKPIACIGGLPPV